MTAPQPEELLSRYRQAKARRGQWESLWQECADFALPSGGGLGRELSPGQRRTDRIFDGTAPDAVEQLAASLLSELTPPWSRWFGLAAGPAVTEAERTAWSRGSKPPRPWCSRTSTSPTSPSRCTSASSNW